MSSRIRVLVGTTVYYVVRTFLDFANVFWWRTEIVGSGNIPKDGAFILAPVHRSNLDGLIAATLTRRRMKYLAKGELFKYVRLGRLFVSMGAISVNRGVPDRKSLNLCLEALTEGSPLVLFPEGGRRDGPTIAEVQEGASYLALRSRVPVVPVGIAGSEKSNPRKSFFVRPVKIRILIGEPIVFTPAGSRVTRAEMTEATASLQGILQKLQDAANAGDGFRKPFRSKLLRK